MDPSIFASCAAIALRECTEKAFHRFATCMYELHMYTCSLTIYYKMCMYTTVYRQSTVSKRYECGCGKGNG